MSTSHDRVRELCLRVCLGRVTDRRARRGTRHSLASMLTIAAVAVASGARSMLAIWDWVNDLPQWGALRALGARWSPHRNRFVVPGGHVTTRADAAAHAVSGGLSTAATAGAGAAGHRSG
ncbi:transposase family protein [Actinophytocola sp.]|uniref:transposase family protein n=1 Tax=Actinophytocola sp. TaxID=1872138 RepID=UPI0039C87C4D